MQQWLEAFTAAAEAAFPGRIVCLGIQGSYGRGEATGQSDIDLVAILDSFSYHDLKTYDHLLSKLAHREKICGFVSGRRELEQWDRAELFQFCHDTIPLVGDLEWLRPLISPADIRRAVHTGACGLYHGCVHNALHERDPELLGALLKSAAFVLQAKCYCETGLYFKKRAQLLEKLTGRDRMVLELLLSPEKREDLDQVSRLLMEWASQTIDRCAPEN